MKSQWTPFRSAMGALALALMVAGCSAPAAPPAAPAATGGGQPSAAPQTPGQPPAAPAVQKIKRGGVMTLAQPSSFAGADPAMGQNAYQLWHFVGTYMLRREPDTWKLVGDAIEKWQFSPDGKELTLTVRKGVKWQNKPPVNGRDIDAKDIVYTLKSITGQQYPDLPPLRFPRKSNLEDMEDATAVDPYTVKVKLKNPSSSFLDGLAEYRSPITPDQVREHFGGRDALANPNPERYLSAGPFILTKYVDLQEAIYERYPEYWEKAADGQSKPYLDTVRNIWIADEGTQAAAFIAGQLSYHSVTNPETRNQVLGARKDAQVFTYEPNSCWYRVAFNMTRKPFDDVRVRKAIVMTLDPVQTGKALFGDWDGKPLWRYPGPLAWAFPESLTQDELAKHPYYQSPKSQKTIDEARKLMAEAGINELSFEMMSSASPTTRDGAQLALSQITKALPNVKIKAVPLDNAIQLERAAKGEFDVQYYCYIHEPTAVAMLKTAYHTKGGRNTARLSDATMDDLLDRAGRELDKARRDALVREAQLRVFEVVSIMPTTHNAAQLAFLPEFRGVRLGGSTLGQGMFAKEIWIDK